MKNSWSEENLPQEVDYKLEDHFITGKQKKWKQVIEWIFTILGWMVMLSYLIYVIYGLIAMKFNWPIPEIAIYTREMLTETGRYFYILFIAILVATVLLIAWKNYNRIRFGRLHRRKFRPPVEDQEILDLFQIDQETLEHMKRDRVIVFSKNIIPEDLGMRYRNQENKRKKSMENQNELQEEEAQMEDMEEPSVENMEGLQTEDTEGLNREGQDRSID